MAAGEYHGEAFWQSAWPLPAIYAAFLIFCMPRDSAIILINRIMIIAVLAVSISLLGIFLLLYEMYRVAMEYTHHPAGPRKSASGRGIPPLYGAAGLYGTDPQSAP